MENKYKLVYISSIAAPHQIKLCNKLQQYFSSEFWFYESALRTRGKFWQIDLGSSCKVLESVSFISGLFGGRYWYSKMTADLDKYNPDIVMLGGFSIPSNYVAYYWAKQHGKKTIVFTERSRDKNGILRRKNIYWRVLHYLYKDVDLVMTSAEDCVEQFKSFGFHNNVVASRYASDLDAYFDHKIRSKKNGYTYLYPNRMTKIYNPLLVIDIFNVLVNKYPDSKLVMNAAGEMHQECVEKISSLGINDKVIFLNNIKSWDDLPLAYQNSDIMILPALFSNGNFTILESMASGMGVVISNKILGVGKLIKDGKNGFNCEPSISEFVKSIEKYINDPEMFMIHAQINRSIVCPLSTSGTAELYANIIYNKLFNTNLGY